MQLEIDVNTILYSLCMTPKLKLKPKVQKPKIFVDVILHKLAVKFWSETSRNACVQFLAKFSTHQY
jgi:hypothetical protein